MKIYTKKGDLGKTSLCYGTYVDKNDPVIEANGVIDECNSALGLAIANLPHNEPYVSCHLQLKKIQHSLFDLGAVISAYRMENKGYSFSADVTQSLELWIDEMETVLTPLKTFVLPGGHSAAACLHQARGICRAAERQIVTLHQEQPMQEEVLAFINRLSDYFFVSARYINHLSGTGDILWEKNI